MQQVRLLRPYLLLTSENVTERHFNDIHSFAYFLKFAQVQVHPFSLHFERRGLRTTAADSARGYSKKTCPTYVHYQFFRISFIVYWFPIAGLLSLSCNWRSRMSGEERRLECTHAHVLRNKPHVQSEKKRGVLCDARLFIPSGAVR